MKVKLLFPILFFFAITLSSTGPYIIPNGPGSELWKSKKSYVERVKLCNIPDSVLRDISTDDLIETVFNFPFIHNIFIFDDFISELDSLNTIYNGIEKLLARNNAPQKLLARYMAYDDKNSYARNIFLEKLISNENIITNIDSTKQKRLMDTLLVRLSNRTKSRNYLNSAATVSSSFLLLKLLRQLDRVRFNNLINNDDKINEFARTSRAPRKYVINKILLEVLRYKR